MTTDEKKFDVCVPTDAADASGTGGSSAGLTRRDLIKAAAVTGAGVLAAPALLRAQAAGGAASIKFGLLEDRSGNFAIFGLNKWHGTQLAIKEINDGWTLDGGVQGPGGPGVHAKVAAKPPTTNIKATVDNGGAPARDDTVWTEPAEYLLKSGDKGVLGRQIELLAPDPQSDNTQFQTLARRLILDDKVDVIMAGFASAEREAIRPIMDQNKMLYFYNNQYEGGVADKNTFCTGAVPEQQIVPVMQYMIKNFGPRIYTLAADYNFGQLSAAWTRAMAPLLNAEVIGEEFIPLSVSQFSSSIAKIQEAKPSWLMMYITGQNHSNFYPQANAAGLKFPMGSSINIAQGYEHRRFAPPALNRFHVTASYMEEIPTPRNKLFVKRWRAMFADEPYLAMEGHSAYVRPARWNHGQGDGGQGAGVGPRRGSAGRLGLHGSGHAPSQPVHPARPLRREAQHHLHDRVAAHRAVVDAAARGEPRAHGGVQAVHPRRGSVLQDVPEEEGIADPSLRHPVVRAT